MANLKPFQVIVTFRDGSKKEYGFNTAMERKIYLWGVMDASGKVLEDIDQHNYKSPCMACNDRPVEKRYVRAKGPFQKTTRTIVELCEECSTNFIALARSDIYLRKGGRIVSDKEAFGLPSFEEMFAKLKKKGLIGGD